MAQFTESAEVYSVLAVLLKPITTEFGWNRSVFAGAQSVGTLLGGFIGPVLGPIFDRYGTRWIVFFSFVILGLTMILMAWITSVWQFYVLQIIGRLLVLGVISLALTIVIPKWFIAKRGRAIALSGLGGRLGNSVTPLYVQALVSLKGWRFATATTGIVMWVFTLLPVGLFLRRQPEDMGLLPDGATPEDAAKAKAAASNAQSSRRQKQDISLTLRQVVREPSFYLLVTSMALGSLVGPAQNLHMIPYFTDQGLSPGVAVVVTSVLFLSGAPGSLLFGVLAERYSIRLILTVDYLLITVGFFLLLAVDSAPKAFVWGVYLGFVQGGGMILNQILFADYYGRASLGSIRGVITPVSLTANAIGPLAAALAYDATGNYVAVWFTFGLLRLASAVLIALALPPAATQATAT